MGKMKKKKPTIAILTGGGDVPGLNPCIKTLVYRAESDPLSQRRVPSLAWIDRQGNVAETLTPADTGPRPPTPCSATSAKLQ